MSSKKHIARILSAARSYRVPSRVTLEFVEKFLASLDCPRALTVWMLFQSGEHSQLASLDINPLDYNSLVEFRGAYAATKFLSKFKDLSLDVDLDEVALLKFEKFELQCKHTNRRFRDISVDPGYTGPTVWLHSAVIQKIEMILRDFSAEEVFSRANWGPGATTLISSRNASAFNKFQCETGITRDLYDLISYSDLTGSILEDSYPLWWSHLKGIGFPNFQVGNKVITVPKDSTTNRVIAIEPGINLWFQKSIGEMINSRLRRFGVDLRFQDRNQKLALNASKKGINATIDFSSASDSISSAVVQELLPVRWFLLLDACRSRFGLTDSGWRSWHKFSSMGNGYTFSLQSLIFFAMASCCKEYIESRFGKLPGETVSVYGDDVIIPVRCLSLFSELSVFYGFTLNSKKSFSSGYFRESCGAHYYSGSDVKPYYLKGNITDIQSLYRAANGVRRLSHRWGSRLVCDNYLRASFDYLWSLVPESLRFRIPETLGDGGFISNFDEAVPVRARHGIEGYFVYHAVEESLSFQSDKVGLLLARLWVPSLQSQQNSVAIRGRTKLRVKRSLVHRWYDLGPWL